MDDSGTKTALHSFHTSLLETWAIVFVSGACRKLAWSFATQPSIQSDNVAHRISSKRPVYPYHVYSEIHIIRRSYRRSHRHQDGWLDFDKIILGGEC